MKISKFFCIFTCAAILTPQAQAWEIKKAPLMTPWASQINPSAPWPEYPRPQMVRNDWLSLNGLWQFQAGSAQDAVPVGKELTDTILVPFPMESAISGVKAYHPNSWYRRTFSVPPAWKGKNIILHLDAVSWESEVFINGKSVNVHKGSYDPISCDITKFLSGSGPQELIVRVFSPVSNGGQPRGKQTLYPQDIMYTSSSGIWQSVWLEPVAESGISGLKFTPDVDNSQLHLTVNSYATEGVSVSVLVTSNGLSVGNVSGAANKDLTVAVPNARLWSPEDPFLYDLKVTTHKNSAEDDVVTSYFGMRKISVGTIDGIKKMLLNDKFVFQLGPLDQGFWPDGNYTAPTDAALRSDIEAEKAFGFNMVRKHIKVEPARWYYWADKLGILVWQDMPSVNSYVHKPEVVQPIDKPQYEQELNRMIDNRWNSPSIIMWVVFNEGQGAHDVAELVNMVKAKDPSRLVNQGSGGPHRGAGDIFDAHSYPAPGCPTTTDQVRVCGEFGGIFYPIEGHVWDPSKSAGTYTNTNDPSQLLTKYEQFMNDILWLKSARGLCAGVYTETTDVENERNGLLTYDRVMKASADKIREINRRAIEATMNIIPLVPISENEGVIWEYTTNKPTAKWSSAAFDDSAWTAAPGGFGEDGRTTWQAQDIWLRQEFSTGKLSPEEVDQLVFMINHRADCQVYLNGILAAEESGRSSTYELQTLSATAKAALVSNGKNVLAVHCHRLKNPPFIDVGLAREVILPAK